MRNSVAKKMCDHNLIFLPKVRPSFGIGATGHAIGMGPNQNPLAFLEKTANNIMDMGNSTR
jgi:hypothetical protein